MIASSVNIFAPMNVRLSLRQPKSLGPKEKIDWRSFFTQSDLQAINTLEVLNHLHVLEEGGGGAKRQVSERK